MRWKLFLAHKMHRSISENFQLICFYNRVHFMVQNIDSSTFSFSLLSTSNYFYALALVMWTCVYYSVSPYNKPIFSIEKTGEKHFEDINRELYWEYCGNYIVGKWKVEKISKVPTNFHRKKNHCFHYIATYIYIPFLWLLFMV